MNLVATVEARIASARERIVETFCQCRCRALRVTVLKGGPLFTTVCHCAMCKAHNFNEGYSPIPFAAVSRADCQVAKHNDGSRGTSGSAGDDKLVWERTSTAVRRGRCGDCGSAMVYHDVESEPNTVWLCYPKVLVVPSPQLNNEATDSGATVRHEEAYDRLNEPVEMDAFDLPLAPFSPEVVDNPNGSYDADVRWDCKGIIPKSPVRWDPATTIPQDVLEAVIARDDAPRGRAHFSSRLYFNDPGSLL